MSDVLRACLKRLLRFKWHQWARLIAALELMDQAIGPVTHIHPSEAIVVVCLGVIFAPVPKEKE